MHNLYRKVAKITLASYLFIQCLNLALFTLPQKTYASVPFTNSYVTLSNSRFSYKGAIATGGIATGATYATIQSSGYSDNDTKNLFLGDTICLNGYAADGCKNSDTATYTVNNIMSDTIFGFSPAISGTMNMNDFIVATQSGQIAVTFKPATALASTEKLIFTIAAASSNYADGIPDSTGFDSGDLTADLVAQSAISSSGATTITITSATLSSAASLHTVTIVLGGALAAGTTYTFVLGHSSNAALRFLNPSPAGTTHTRGISDSYSMTLKSTNAGGTVIYDQTQLKVNPIDGVFVSATVEQTLSFKIEPLNTGTVCGVAQGSRVTTTATTIPFGSIITDASFYDAAQLLTVSTNSTGGYTVTGYEDGVLTSGSNNIPNTPCDAGTCSSGTPGEWNSTPITNTNDGFGFSLEQGTNSPVPAAYAYDNGATFNAQPFPLNLFPTPGISVMSEVVPASASTAKVCYRLGAKATQPAGYYYNRITYVATPKF